MTQKNTYLKLSTQKKIYLQSKAIEFVQNGVVITDINGCIIYANPYSSILTGYTSDELIGETPRVFKSGEHKEKFYKEMWDVISSGRKWKGEIINKKKDGELWVELLTITPVKDDNGTIEFYVGIQQDITKERELKKQTEIKVKNSLEELSDYIKNKSK